MKEKSSVNVFKEMGIYSAYPTCLFKDCEDAMVTNGFTRVGGIPCVPEIFEWPKDERKHIPFIGQFKGSEAAGSWFGSAGGIIKEGLYYIFFDPKSFYGQRPELEPESGFKRKTGVKILYYPDEGASLKDHKYPKDLEDRGTPSIHLQSQTLYSLPGGDFRMYCNDDDSILCNLSESTINAIRKLPYEVDPVTRLQVGGFPTRFDGLSISPIDHFDLYYDGGIEMRDRWVLFAEFQMNLEPLDADSSQNICLWIRSGDLVSQSFDEVYATMN